MEFLKSFIQGVKSQLVVYLFRARVGHGLFWVSVGFLMLVAGVVVSVNLKNQWNYKTLKPRGQVGLNFKNSIEMIEVGSLVLGHNAGVSAVGMGSKLISKKAMELKDYDAIKTDTKTVLELIQAIKNN